MIVHRDMLLLLPLRRRTSLLLRATAADDVQAATPLRLPSLPKLSNNNERCYCY
jgi:hypothetical protein